MKEDNWEHRSEGMRCKTCMFFVPKIKARIPGQDENPKSYDIGRCRINAPTLKGWPVMFPDDWCGEHRLDENKIATGHTIVLTETQEKFLKNSKITPGKVGTASK